MEMVVINGVRYRPEAVPKEHRDAIEAQKKASPQGKTRTASTKTAKLRGGAAAKAKREAEAAAAAAAQADQADQKAEEDGEGGDS